MTSAIPIASLDQHVDLLQTPPLDHGYSESPESAYSSSSLAWCDQEQPLTFGLPYSNGFEERPLFPNMRDEQQGWSKPNYISPSLLQSSTGGSSTSYQPGWAKRNDFTAQPASSIYLSDPEQDRLQDRLLDELFGQPSSQCAQPRIQLGFDLDMDSMWERSAHSL
jgi:hypothetical protein